MANKGETKWCYQIIDHGKPGEPDLCVHEVYFDTVSKKVKYYTENPVRFSGYENREELIKDLEMMLADLKNEENKIIEIEEIHSSFD